MLGGKPATASKKNIPESREVIDRVRGRVLQQASNGVDPSLRRKPMAKTSSWVRRNSHEVEGSRGENRSAAIFFEDIDVNGDGVIDRAEFLSSSSYQPKPKGNRDVIGMDRVDGTNPLPNKRGSSWIEAMASQLSPSPKRSLNVSKGWIVGPKASNAPVLDVNSDRQSTVGGNESKISAMALFQQNEQSREAIIRQNESLLTALNPIANTPMPALTGREGEGSELILSEIKPFDEADVESSHGIQSLVTASIHTANDAIEHLSHRCALTPKFSNPYIPEP